MLASPTVSTATPRSMWSPSRRWHDLARWPRSSDTRAYADPRIRQRSSRCAIFITVRRITCRITRLRWLWASLWACSSYAGCRSSVSTSRPPFARPALADKPSRYSPGWATRTQPSIRLSIRFSTRSFVTPSNVFWPCAIPGAVPKMWATYIRATAIASSRTMLPRMWWLWTRVAPVPNWSRSLRFDQNATAMRPALGSSADAVAPGAVSTMMMTMGR